MRVVGGWGYDCPMRITFVRHGETPDNAARIWQGHGGGGLSERGQSQARALGERLASRSFSRVITSDVLRVIETASFLEKSVEIDSRFREIDVGQWAGREIPETYRESPDVFAGMQAGEDVRLGGDGESLFEFRERVATATSQLIGELDHDDDVLVLSHGGFIANVVANLFGYTWPSTPTTLAMNTSMSVLEFGSSGTGKLQVYNDAAHLGPRPHVLFPGEGHILTLVRHGQTDANRQDRWYGHKCDGLNDWGKGQAADLWDWLGPQAVVHSSDTPRAVATAEGLAQAPVTLNEGLRETFLGEWEGLTTAEIMDRWPEEFSRIFADGEDLPRGVTGESHGALTKRFRSEIDSIVEGGEDTTVVTHGGAIRSYVLDVLGTGWEQSSRLDFPRNTSVARIHIAEDKPRLVDYGVGPHLEG